MTLADITGLLVFGGIGLVLVTIISKGLTRVGR